MKKILLFTLGTCIMVSCAKKDENNVPNSNNASIVQSTNETTSSETFSIETLPISTIDLGDFPFFSAPKDAKYINNVKPKDFDFIVFGTPNELIEVEGKTFRAWIHPDAGKEISARYLFKSYEDAILKAGGVKVFEGNLEGDRLEKYNQLVTYKGSDGTFIPSGDTKMVTYAINHSSGPIYIVYGLENNNTASIQIVQAETFKQTIEKITADKIVEDLSKTGKSILYINFDVDKSTLSGNGTEVVNEIASALKKDTNLKISIEGHTDNTGEVSHNKKLSTERANSVVTALVNHGIDKSRLSSKGFGSEKPLAPNDSEENKSKNRRVELVRM